MDQYGLQLQNFATQRESGIESVRTLFEQAALSPNEEEHSQPSHAFPRNVVGRDPHASSTQHRKRDWSKLSRDVCLLIAERAAFRPHLSKFASACKEWCNVSKDIPPPLMLFLPFNEQNSTCRFIGPKADTALYDLTLPELKSHWVCGCTNGWLGLINDNFDMALFNPITHVRVPLPRFTIKKYIKDTDSYFAHCPSESLVKLVISGDPHPAQSASTIIAIIFRPFYRLAVCRLGDESWTVIETTKYPHREKGFQDVIFHNKTMYAVNKRYKTLYEINFHRSHAVSIKQIPIPFDRRCFTADQMYIVLSSENILFVERHINVDRIGDARRPTLTDKFVIYQLEYKTEKWNRLEDLGGHSLFLGLSASLSVSSKEFRFWWCRPDCVYFLDDNMIYFIAEHRGFNSDNGIFSVVENRVVSRLDIQHSLNFWPAPALWYLPNV